MSKHTPGEWKWNRVNEEWRIPVITLEGPSVLCRYWDTIGGKPIAVNKRTLADAALIKTSPKMLKALEKVAAFHDPDREPARDIGLWLELAEELHEEVVAVIREAEGETDE